MCKLHVNQALHVVVCVCVCVCVVEWCTPECTTPQTAAFDLLDWVADEQTQFRMTLALA